MRQVLATTDRAFLESCLIALEAEGIDAIVHNESGSSLPFVPVTVAVTEDADYEEARAVLRRLQSTPRPSVEQGSWLERTWRLALLAVLALVLTLCLQSVG